MPFLFKFHRLAEREAQDAATFLDGLYVGGPFVEELTRVIGLVTTHPRIGRVVHTTRSGIEVRQFRLRHFRYVLVWLVTDQPPMLTILAVAPASRRPKYWARRVNRS